MTPRRTHRLLSAALTALTVATLALLHGPLPAAQAHDGRLEFSTDGSTWTSTPPAALFDGDVVLVPGGSVDATLHLRSTAETPGMLTTAVTNVRASDQDAEEHFGLQAVTDAGTGIEGAGEGLDRTRVADLDEYTLLGSRLRLEPGQSAMFRLTIDLDLRPGGTGAQNSAIALDLAISLTDAAATAEEGPDGEAAADADGGRSSAPGDGTGPQLILPVLPPGEAGQAERSHAPQTEPAAGQEHDRGAEEARGGADGAAAEERGALSVTGLTGRLFLVATVVTLLGAGLRAASRHRRKQS